MEQARLLSFILVKQLSQVKSEQTNELNVKSLKSFEVFKVVVNEDNNLFPETQLHGIWTSFMSKNQFLISLFRLARVLYESKHALVSLIFFFYL